MSGEEYDLLTVEDLHEIATGVLDEVVVREAGLLACYLRNGRDLAYTVDDAEW